MEKLSRIHTEVQHGYASIHNEKINEIVDKLNEIVETLNEVGTNGRNM